MLNVALTKYGYGLKYYGLSTMVLKTYMDSQNQPFTDALISLLII